LHIVEQDLPVLFGLKDPESAGDHDGDILYILSFPDDNGILEKSFTWQLSLISAKSRSSRNSFKPRSKFSVDYHKILVMIKN